MDETLPKGMIPPEPEGPVTLADGNYGAAIRAALSVLPVEIRVDRCVIVERDGHSPTVRMSLTVLPKREVRGRA